MSEIIETINRILVEENAKPLKDENDLLIDSELDSFRYVSLWKKLNKII